MHVADVGWEAGANIPFFEISANRYNSISAIYNSISAKLNCLLDCLAKTEEELQNHDSTETGLKFFSKVLSLLKLSSECNDLGLT